MTSGLGAKKGRLGEVAKAEELEAASSADKYYYLELYYAATD